jgi:hypothetical protein
MTKDELIEALKDIPGDAEVYIQYNYWNEFAEEYTNEEDSIREVVNESIIGNGVM